MYASFRHIDSARLMPIALTLMRTSVGPGAGTFVSRNSRTSGPPTFANLIVRDMTTSRFGPLDKKGLSIHGRTSMQLNLGSHCGLEKDFVSWWHTFQAWTGYGVEAPALLRVRGRGRQPPDSPQDPSPPLPPPPPPHPLHS